ncbi:MAG: cobalamin-binding protein [Steroidobacter sp.]
MIRVRFVLLCALLVSACSPSSRQPNDQQTGQAAHRIVALAPNLAELVYAAGAGQYLVGTVDYADYPEAAKSVPHVGDALRVDMERLLALKPDLILIWPSGTPASVLEQVRSLGLPVQEIDAQRIDEVGQALRMIGKDAGTEAAAEQVATHFENAMNALREQYRHRARLSVFIQVNDQPLYTVNKNQIISEVVELCGGDNVFAGLNQLAPVIGIEAVIQNNPQVILSTDSHALDLASQWHSWPQLQAVREHHLYTVTPDNIARASPRLVKGTEEVCEALDRARG